MASDGQSVKLPAASLVHASQAPTTVSFRKGGNILPHDGLPGGKSASPKADLQAQIALLNKFTNDSGRAAQFRAADNNRSIEEVNPATGEVVAAYPAAEFAALAKSVGISGGIIDAMA